MDGTNDVPQPTIKVYKRRWAMLSLYFIVGSVTVMQWTQYIIIADVVVKYYNVSYEIVNWSMMIFLLVFIVFVLPGNYVLHALGLRNFFLLTSFLQCVGCWLKILAVNPNRFWLALVCQAIFGLTHVFILSIPSLIAMTWFDINEISTATSIGTLQPQLSSALGFIIPTFIISSTYEENVFERNLFIMVLTIAIFSTVCLVLIFFFFEDKPPIPPSEAQFYHERGRKHLLNIVPFVKHLMQNSSFMLILFICGINNGIMGSIDTLLNQIIVQNYEDSSTEAGRIVCLEYFLGSAGNLVAGIILDKFHHFKITMRTSQGICFLLMIIFTYIIQRGILGLYIVLSFIGFFGSFLAFVCFETVMENTYPVPENISSGIFYATQYILIIIFTNLYSWIFYTLGGKWSNHLMCALHLLAFLLCFCVRYTFHRKNLRAVSTLESNIKLYLKPTLQQ